MIPQTLSKEQHIEHFGPQKRNVNFIVLPMAAFLSVLFLQSVLPKCDLKF